MWYDDNDNVDDGAATATVAAGVKERKTNNV